MPAAFGRFAPIAGNERNFVHPSRSTIDRMVLATSNMFLDIKPPPFPICSMRAAMSSEEEAWKSRTGLSPEMPVIEPQRPTIAFDRSLAFHFRRRTLSPEPADACGQALLPLLRTPWARRAQ